MNTKLILFAFAFALSTLLLVRPGASPAPARAQIEAKARAETLRSLYGLPAVASLRRDGTALLLVDFQREFFDGSLPLPGGQEAAQAASELLRWARAAGVRVAHVTNVAARRDSPIFRFGSPAVRIIDPLAPQMTEPVFTKSTGGAFTGTELEAWLRSKRVDTLIVGGLMTHLAVQLSATDGAVRGFRVIVVRDATASRDLPGAAGGPIVDHASVERAALAALADRFADVMTAAQIEALPLGD